MFGEELNNAAVGVLSNSLFEGFEQDIDSFLSISPASCHSKEKYILPAGSVIIRISGRIGNQLFGFAASFSLAQQTESLLYIYVDNSIDYEQVETITYFNIPKEHFIFKNKCNEEYFNTILKNYDQSADLVSFYGRDIKITVVDDKNFFEVAKQKNTQILVMKDYFQTPMIFDNYKQKLLEYFQITKVDNEKLNLLLSEISQPNSVCIHFRTNYKGMDGSDIPWYKTSIKYYEQSIQLFKKLVNLPRFYIFIDDEMIGTREKLKSIDNSESYSFEFIDNYGPMEDLYLMSNCGNNIIARSTFSWWAAYLNQNNGFMIAPYKPYHDELFSSYSYGDVYVKKAVYDNHYPDSWILLDEREQNLLTAAKEYIADENIRNNIMRNYTPRELDIYSGDHAPLKICEGKGDFRPSICYDNNDKPTIITTYYGIANSSSHDIRFKWISTFLNIPFNLVVYTDKENTDWIKSIRGDKPLIVIDKAMENKAKFVQDSINSNYYNSKFFVWCNIDIFEEQGHLKYNLLTDKYMLPGKFSIGINSEFTENELSTKLTDFRRNISQSNVIFGDKESWKTYVYLFDLTKNEFITQNVSCDDDQVITNTMIIKYPKLFHLIYQNYTDNRDRF